MGEYLLTVPVPAGETRKFPIPSMGIAGVYSNSSLTLKWDFNGNVAELMNTDKWEPFGGFHPAATSILVLDNSAGSTAADVAIRCYE